MEETTVRAMGERDLAEAAKVHAECFVRQTMSQEWLECSWKAFPRMLCFVAMVDNAVEGYIIWSQKSGFRPEAVVELEQLAVRPPSQGCGIAKKLIQRSLDLVRMQLADQGSRLKHVIVTTRADNHAQKLYKNLLGARIEATLTNLYSADEVIMIARNV